MNGRRSASFFVAALLAVSPAFSQVRTAPVVVPVPGAAAGIAVVGVAASLKPQSALPSAPVLSLPASALPSPASALAPLAHAAQTEAALRATLPSAAAPAVQSKSDAASVLSSPSGAANEAKAPNRAERRKAVLDGIAEATGWKIGKPDAAAATLARRGLGVDAAQIGSRLNSMFDGSGQSAAGTVSIESLEPAPAAQGSVAGPALLAELRARTRRGHSPRSYDEAKSAIFTHADSVVVDGVRGVRDSYSGVFVPGTSGTGGDYRERGDQDGDGYHDKAGMNVEHLWPQSYFSEKLPMRSDLHHLMATFQRPNGMRGRLPFDEVPDGKVEYHNNAGARMGGGLFEPPDSAKGRVARAMLYFMARYGDQNVLPRNVVNHFWNARLQTFLRWNRQFPPSKFEVDRNSVVEKIQGNRNPFVDDPSLADRVGVEGFQLDGGRKALARASASGPGAQVSGREAGRHDNKGRRNHRNHRNRR